VARIMPSPLRGPGLPVKRMLGGRGFAALVRNNENRRIIETRKNN